MEKLSITFRQNLHPKKVARKKITNTINIVKLIIDPSLHSKTKINLKDSSPF